MGAGASAHAETAREGGQQITKYGRYAVTMDNDKPIRVSRPDAVRRRAGRSDVTVYRSGAFTVEVVDDDVSHSTSNSSSEINSGSTRPSMAAASASASASATSPSASQKGTAGAAGYEFQTPAESELTSADCSSDALSRLGVKQLKRELELRQIKCADCIEKSQLIARLLEYVKKEFSSTQSE